MTKGQPAHLFFGRFPRVSVFKSRPGSIISAGRLPPVRNFDISIIMEIKDAVSALSALAHGSRLAAFRLLVKAPAEGLPAGEIADELDVAPPTLSFHLSHLVRAGLIDSRRDGRSIFYSLRVEGIRGLLQFVTEDCCQGRAELCVPKGRRSTACQPNASRMPAE